MRSINEKVIVIEEKTVEKTVVAEDFSHYVVNKREKLIDVSVEKTDTEGKVITTEKYSFFNEEYVNNFTESVLWLLIDKRRAEGNTF